MSSMRPCVAALTHSLIRTDAEGLAKLSSATSASKVSLTVSKKSECTGKPSRVLDTPIYPPIDAHFPAVSTRWEQAALSGKNGRSCSPG